MAGLNPWSAPPPPTQTLLNILSAQGCKSNITKEDIASDPSLTLIQSLHDISSLSEQLQKSEVELLSRSLYRDNAELLSVSNIEKLQKTADELTCHLSRIAEHNDMLLTKLKTPHGPNQFVMEARYQKYAATVFRNLGSVLTSLPTHLQNVERFRDSGFDGGEVKRSVDQIDNFSRNINTLYLSLHSMLQTLECIEMKSGG